jgi:FkbM family methyltransferase
MSAVINLLRFLWRHPLTQGPQAMTLAIGRVAKWQIQSRLEEEVIVSWVGGQKLAVKRGMTGATGNVYAGLHEFPEMMFVLHFLTSDDLFYDVGANVGAYTVLASGVRKARTCAFEPDVETLLALKRNVEVNGLQQLVTAFPLALGATHDEVPFTIGLDTVNRIASSQESNCRIVQQRPLDSFPGDPIFIKMDVEGYEEQVLHGASTVLERESLRAIQLETVTSNSERILNDHGFSKAFYDPFNRVLSKGPNGLTSANTLFIRDVSFVIDRIRASLPVLVLNRLI